MNPFIASLQQIDYSIFNFINQFAFKNPHLDWVAKFFAEKLQFILVVFLALIVLKNFKKYFWPVVVSVFAAIFSRFFIVEIIRYLLPRTRPFVENSINLLIDYNPNESSFPSGHASFFFALAMAICLYNKRLGVIFFVSAFLISISRVFIGIHWPMDIIAGAIVGIITGWLVFKAAKKILKK